MNTERHKLDSDTQTFTTTCHRVTVVFYLRTKKLRFRSVCFLTCPEMKRCRYLQDGHSRGSGSNTKGSVSEGTESGEGRRADSWVGRMEEVREVLWGMEGFKGEKDLIGSQ